MTVSIAGINLIDSKAVPYALIAIFGIGINSAKKICDKAKIKHSIKIKDLDNEQVALISRIIEEEYVIGADRKKIVMENIRKKIAIKCYQGDRHKKKLPVRGQRTHTNARTRKGKAVAIAGKKKATK